jgi:hypothetical protein
VPADIFADLRSSRDLRAIVAAGHGSPFADSIVATAAGYDVVAPKSVDRHAANAPALDAISAA